MWIYCTFGNALDYEKHDSDYEKAKYILLYHYHIIYYVISR